MLKSRKIILISFSILAAVMVVGAGLLIKYLPVKQKEGMDVITISFIRDDAPPHAQVEAEVARTVIQRSQGLMFRETLDAGKGMLFVYPFDDNLNFYMKNTSIPLSIAFISSTGVITEIKDMEPFDIETVSSTEKVRYALEVPQGWFATAGIAVGDIAVFNLTSPI